MSHDVEIRQTEKKGKGVFALRDFRKGEVIFSNQRGTLVKAEDLEKIWQKEGDHLNEIDRETWEIMNPPGRFVNHSCDPNAIPDESSKETVPYIALRPIKRGEEITADYRINGHTGDTWKCQCGGKNCSGSVTSDFFTLSGDLQKKYLPYSPKFIKDEYNRRHEIGTGQ